MRKVVFDQYRKFPSQQMPVIVALLQIIRSQINAREGSEKSPFLGLIITIRDTE